MDGLQAIPGHLRPIGVIGVRGRNRRVRLGRCPHDHISEATAGRTREHRLVAPARPAVETPPVGLRPAPRAENWSQSRSPVGRAAPRGRGPCGGRVPRVPGHLWVDPAIGLLGRGLPADDRSGRGLHRQAQSRRSRPIRRGPIREGDRSADVRRADRSMASVCESRHALGASARVLFICVGPDARAPAPPPSPARGSWRVPPAP